MDSFRPVMRVVVDPVCCGLDLSCCCAAAIRFVVAVYINALVDFKDSFISFGQDKRIMPYFILEIVIQETNTQNRKSRLTTTKAP